MNTVGCINAGKCHTNLCPVGITSHLPHLEAGVVVQEKRFRTANYLRTMRREGLFMLGASCGIDSPSKFSKRHIALRESNNKVNKIEEFISPDPSVYIAQIKDISKQQQSEEKKELVGS
ncbi:glutamate synthase-related protein [Pseudogracilibacillus sp. SO30301A]